MQLEQRLMFSAGPMAAVAELVPAGEAATAADSLSGSELSAVSPELSTDSSVTASASDSPVSAELSDEELFSLLSETLLPSGTSDSTVQPSASSSISASPDTAQQQTLELVFIDPSVGDVNQLISELQNVMTKDPSRTLKFIALDAQSAGVARITYTLLRFQQVDGIHLVSRGTDGAITLGNTTLTAASLNRCETAISGWQYSLKNDADILIYGGHLADTADG